jgi:uncharacterized protein YyaL (SSP411 family)
VDKTLYVNWNAMMCSASLEAAKVLGLPEARAFAIKTLERIFREAWSGSEGLSRVIAYNEGAGTRLRGTLDDYAFLTLAALDAYEATSEIEWFHRAQSVCDQMLLRFEDADQGGFFDAESSAQALGALSVKRKALQDSPTPAGNPAAAIALLRMHAYTNDPRYQESARRTLQVFAGIAGQYGIFAGTYGIAVKMLLQPHTQVCIIGEGTEAELLNAAAVAPFSVQKSVLRLRREQLKGLPPALAETLPNLPSTGNAVALICSGFSCQPPISNPDQLEQELRRVLAQASS